MRDILKKDTLRLRIKNVAPAGEAAGPGTTPEGSETQSGGEEGQGEQEFHPAGRTMVYGLCVGCSGTRELPLIKAGF